MLHRFAFPNSLGQFYEQVTSGLGFKPSRHEGKIVGLAAYGDPSHLRQVLLDRFELRRRRHPHAGRPELLTSPAPWPSASPSATWRPPTSACSKRSPPAMVAYWLKKTGLTNVAVSGGVHANVKLNQRIREIEGVEAVFVYPNMGDGGCGTGAAMLAFDRAVFAGPAAGQRLLRPRLLRRRDRGRPATQDGLAFERCDDIEDRVAQLLTQDHIIGRFNGRMEYGPRALGNRSVLYPAQDPEVNQWLNHQLGRTEFMPFAPAALASEAHRLFQEPVRLREDRRVHDDHLRLHRGDEAAVPGRGPRRRHRPAAARQRAHQPQLPPHPRGATTSAPASRR